MRLSIAKPLRKAIYPAFMTRNDLPRDLSYGRRLHRLISHLQALLRDGERISGLHRARCVSVRMTVTGTRDGHF
jgi:hypothetical protein